MKTKLNIKRKATIDDGMNPELVRGADFDGYNGIPIIKKPTEIIGSVGRQSGGGGEDPQ